MYNRLICVEHLREGMHALANASDLRGLLRSHAPKIAKAAALSCAIALSCAAPTNLVETLQEKSVNWSGYVELGRGITSISSRFTVPKVSEGCDIMQNDAETIIMQPSLMEWIGIGGMHEKSLMQAGAYEQFDVWGRPEYRAFIEMLPYGADPINGFEVRPGDTLKVSINRIGASAKFRIDIENLSSKEHYSTIKIYPQDPEKGYYIPSRSAEWVVEKIAGEVTLAGGPSVVENTYYPANGFGSVNFSQAKISYYNGQEQGIENTGPLFAYTIYGPRPDHSEYEISYPLRLLGNEFTVKDGKCLPINPSVANRRVTK